MGLALGWRIRMEGRVLIWNSTLILGQKGVHHQGTPHRGFMMPQGLGFMLLLKKETDLFFIEDSSKKSFTKLLLFSKHSLS